ncbi:HalOD1 output domain-containing protein [Halorarum salinum]|uniref:Halobacterial output domain-containing protein n=1 Tax=Halorarum salinum TaxID=2743089 RepID=A0A7D5LCI2_9EURY|nr:hypothetical protein [Halobaculum salinum]QLG63311.1 hypothetical protein HUG12_16865 [Halobaculum salinum]
MAIIETMAVFENGEPRKAADVLETPLSEHVGTDALDALVGNDALTAISLTISDYHVLISENTVGIEPAESASHAT